MKTSSVVPLPLEELSTEVRKLFHRLRATAEALHASLPLSIPQRAILEDLYVQGPQSVPQMARSRPVSRQHIQKLVNQLLKQKFVEAHPNPAHKTSVFIRLTLTGRTIFEKMKSAERNVFLNLPASITEKDLISAISVLREVRQYLERFK